MFNSLRTSHVAANLVILLISPAIAFMLACMDGGRVGFFKKFTAPEWVVSGEDLIKHEAFQPDYIGYEKNQIILTGSCELLSIWATRERVDNRFSIARQLESEFYARGIDAVRVLNLSLPIFTTTHNLHIFLRFLDNPRYKVFIWHNDFNTQRLADNQMMPDDFIFASLVKLKKDCPDIPEINQMLHSRYNGRSQIIEPQSSSLPVQKSSDFDCIRQVFVNLGSDLTMNMKFMFENWRKPEAIQDRLKSNSLYLREFQRRLPEYLGFAAPLPSPIDLGPVMSEKYPPEFWRLYRIRQAIKNVPGKTLQQDNILSLRLMGKLAQRFHKRIYVYFGPEGGVRQQEGNVYTEKYKMPIINALKDLPAVHIIDLTGLDVKQGSDAWSSANLSYLGNEKVAKKIFEVLHQNEQGFLF